MAVILLPLLAPAAARAAEEGPAPNVERARLLHDEGDFAAAAAVLEAILAGNPDPRLLFDLGEAYRTLGDWTKAVEAYVQYLAAVPKAANGAAVKQLIEELRPLTVEGAKPPAEDRTPPRIHHQPPGTWPPGQVLTIEAEIADPAGMLKPRLYYRSREGADYLSVELAQGDGATYSAPLAAMKPGALWYFLEAFDNKGNGPARHGTPSYPHRVRIVEPEVAGAEAPADAPVVVGAPAEAVAPEAIEIGAEPALAEGPSRVLTWIAGGLAVGAAGGAGIFGAMALDAFDGKPRFSSVESDVQARAGTANVLWGVAAASAAAAVIFYLSEW